ncbi:MAG: hypothetical protein KAQ65_08775 [Candidatus Thorarchaeota archaeon]|nr:hypothetical protein [Candidatus Thorarchaeota archaeon]MCK5239189.1 hypothetical protein [Candidatus Thorarchaeota archaeon]
MGRIKYSSSLRSHINRFGLHDKIGSIIKLLGTDAQQVFDWAEEEVIRQGTGKKNPGKVVYSLIAYEAAIRLVQENHRRGRLTTKNEIKKRTGQKVEMPVLYREAGLRHPQEARNLRHNLFHEAFEALIMHLFPDVSTSVPSTGEGLTPDLMVTHSSPDWTISVEYKGYRSITLLSESEVLKGMRYQQAYGTAWLVTTSSKTVRDVYGPVLKSEEIIERGLKRLENITKRKTFTEEQRENRGIARKGITHLQKHIGENLSCKHVTAEEILESCKKGKPVKGLAISAGFEFVELLQGAGLHKHADNVLRVMKSPTGKLHSDTVTSVRLIG